MIDSEPGVDELIGSDSPLVLPNATRQPHGRPRFSRLWFPGAREVPGGWYGPGVGGAVDTKISQLTAATSFLDADEIPVNEAGVTKKVTGTLLKAWVGQMLSNGSSTSQAPAAATRTYITGSNIAVPVGKIRIGTVFRWRFNMTKTAAGVAASTIDVAFGTAGTTADTARLSFTKPAGTAVIDEGWVIIEAISRGPLSASGIFSGEMIVHHNLATTGHMGQQDSISNIISGAFDVTVANLIVGVCITTGAADAITIQQITAEAANL